MGLCNSLIERLGLGKVTPFTVVFVGRFKEAKELLEGNRDDSVDDGELRAQESTNPF